MERKEDDWNKEILNKQKLNDNNKIILSRGERSSQSTPMDRYEKSADGSRKSIGSRKSKATDFNQILLQLITNCQNNTSTNTSNPCDQNDRNNKVLQRLNSHSTASVIEMKMLEIK
jgi:hypothetical protein